jgi:hypothetical protein
MGIPAVRVESGVPAFVSNVAGSELEEEAGGGAASGSSV